MVSTEREGDTIRIISARKETTYLNNLDLLQGGKWERLWKLSST